MALLAALRKQLIVTAVAVMIGMGVAWNFSPALLSILEKPLSGQTYLSDMKNIIYLKVKEHYPSLYTRLKMDKDLASAGKKRQLNYSSPLEPFFVQCKISMLAGLFLALPVIFIQLWRVIAPRLGQREKLLVSPFVISGTLSFCVGAGFFLMFIWPFIINFSLSYELTGLQSWFSLSAYVNFCLRLILVFGLIFELPVITLLLSRLGIVSHALLARNRKYALLASAVIAAFHSDLITMFFIMVPLYSMYELSIWVTRLSGGKRTSVAPVPA
jgi:sec-independent protein translocase protein TatC